MNIILKFMLTLLMINVTLTFVIGAYNNSISQASVTDPTTQLEQTGTFLQNEELAYGTPDPDQQITDKNFGNQMSWGLQLFQIFANGLNPFAMPEATNTLELLLFSTVTWVRSIMYIITLLYAYLLIRGVVTI